MSESAIKYLEKWLNVRLPNDQWEWLQSRLKLLSNAENVRDLHISLGLVPRKLGRADLSLTDAEMQAFRRSSNHAWNPSAWSIETAARVLILCKLAKQDEPAFGATFKQLCRTADLTETITFYRGISLYPHSAQLDAQIGEGLRTNMRAVFEAIAHGNPYPKTHFDQNRWNHMVLKALFIDSTLAPIQGLDERANAELARILCDYAHERWAANRLVTPELWRCVGPFAQNDMLDDLQRAAGSQLAAERNAALLALSQCPDQKAADLLSQFTDESAAIKRGDITWLSLDGAVQSAEAH